MIIDNYCTEEGDVLLIKTDLPIIGLTVLSSFVDNTNETLSVYFEKSFRYSLTGGVTWEIDFISLTNENLQLIPVNKKDTVVFEYRYKRTGISALNLEVTSINISGEYEQLNFTKFNSSFFSEFIVDVNNIDILKWALNVLEKIVRDFTPPFIEVTKDYVTMMYIFTHMFSVVVNYGRIFKNLKGNKKLLGTFLTNKGIYVNEKESVFHLLNLYENHMQEFKNRGTKMVFELSGGYKGEFSRLLNRVESDPFYLVKIKRGELGWCVGNSSPLFKDGLGIQDCELGYVDISDSSMDNYPLVNKTEITYIDSRTFNIATYSSEVVGFYETLLTDKYITVNPNIPLEISFGCKFNSYVGNLKFDVICFDEHGVRVNLIDSAGDDNNNFFPVSSTSIPYRVTDTYIRFRAKIFENSHSGTDFGLVMGVEDSQNLRFSNNVKYLLPRIYTEGSSDETDIEINDIQIRINDLGFSRGTLCAKNYNVLFAKNNSKYEDSQVTKIFEDELIPFNNKFKINYIQ